MAVTQLSDLNIAPEIFVPSMLLEMLQLNAFIASGVAVVDPELNAFLTGGNGGSTFSPRYFGPLPDADANASSDDPAQKSTPQKITGVKNTAVRQSLNQSWSSMDLNASLYGVDPLGAVTSQVAAYWNTETQKRALASLHGLFLGNIANNGGDMVVDATTETAAADKLFNADAFIDAQGTMGDRLTELSAVAVHSTVYTTMRKLNLIEFVPNSEGTRVFPYYGDLPLIIDDAVTTSGTGADKKYFTYLFGPGSIALGAGAAKSPFAIKRDEDAGNGGGQETMFSRTELVIHPQGFQCTLTDTPTPTELATATSWTRAFERKRVQLACLITAG